MAVAAFPVALRRPEVGILLVNVGSPSKPDSAAVRVFLRQFLADPRVVEAPRLRWWIIRNLAILPLRPRRSAKLYRSVWTKAGSPLVVTTLQLADRLNSDLRRVFSNAVAVTAGMRYGEPSIPRVLADLRERGCRRLLVLPLYPQYSGTTTGSALDAVGRDLALRRVVPEIRTITGYANHEAYIAALAKSVRSSRGNGDPTRHLLMSFHGIPTRYADSGDPYPRQCEETARRLAGALGLGPDQWSMSYQSRFGRGDWLSPATAVTLSELGHAGTDALDVICPGFAVDCLETLEEIAADGRGDYESSGGRGFRYIPALNDSDTHVRALSAIVQDHIAGWL
jgi:ferrochelatase